MSSKEWIAKQQRKVDELLTLFPKAVQTSHVKTMERIYEQGYLSDQGNYRFEYNDTTPVYINPIDAPKKITPEGKPRRKGTKKVRGLKTPVKRGLDTFERKTKYFRSYKAYRAAMSKKTAYVNLDLTGLQESDNSTSLTIFSLGRVGVGFKNAANSRKFAGQRGKYGNFHKPNEAEKKVLFEAIEDQRRRLAV